VIFLRLLLFVTLTANCLVAQDTTYARQLIRQLTSKKCFGRGYVNDGLKKAGDIILREINAAKARPLFLSGFTQEFYHPVNTVKECRLTINNKKLRTGYDFIPDPAVPVTKGRFELQKADSDMFVSKDDKHRLRLRIKNKLTYSVSGDVNSYSSFDVLRSALPGEPVSAEVKVRSKLVTRFNSRNIGCVITGTSDSMVVFSAHYDHLGGIDGDVYFPGANDNASGVSMVLDLLRYYANHPPVYTTVFIFFAGEEAGLLGSKYFTEHNTVDLRKIKFLINLDLLGTGEDGIMVVNGAVHQDRFSVLQEINKNEQLLKQVNKRGKAANSDHYWFSEKGVPCFFIYTMGGIKAYHDVMDIERTLPLTEYNDVFRLITRFVSRI
jgi:aminopeptidase YwaD